MNIPEYDGSPTSEDAQERASSRGTTDAEAASSGAADTHAGSTDEREARAHEQRKAVEEEAIEAEHLDYFLEHVSGPEH